jgi:purine-binding chemotaxis protein CheW
MSSSQFPGGEPQNPDEILSSYLDDLLGTDDLLGLALDSMDQAPEPVSISASETPVIISKPSAGNKNQAAGKTVVPTRPAAPTSSTVIPLPIKNPDGTLTHRRLPPVTALNEVVAEAQPQIAEPQFAQPAPTYAEEQKKKLEKLLQSARTQLLEETPVSVPVETPAKFIDNPGEIQEWVIEPSQVAVPEQTAVAAVEDQQARFQLAGLEWLENGRPQWAQSRFDVLLFQVAGLTLAVPLIALGQIQPITEELTPLFGQADWFMGLQPTPAGKIRTVNTARFVMPERYDESFVKTAKYVVSIDGVPWGLAVDSVNQPITLQPEHVKWRGDRSKRPWLAGTVKDHMCALLDIPRIGQMLIEADKNFMRARNT